MIIQAGDKVHWTKVGKSKKTLSMQRMDGVVESVDVETAVVKLKSGRTKEVPVAQLRLPEEKSQITDFVEAVVEENRRKRGCVL